MAVGGLDQDTLLRLLLSQRASLLGYILSIVRDTHLAEDVFQAVSLITLKKGGEVEEADRFAGWVRRTARFEALNALRKRRNAPLVIDEAVLDALEDHWGAADPDPPAADALRECVRGLTDRSRQILELRYRENVGGAALAAKLGRPVNTVYVALSRIHKTLAACVRRHLSRQGLAPL